MCCTTNKEIKIEYQKALYNNWAFGIRFFPAIESIFLTAVFISCNKKQANKISQNKQLFSKLCSMRSKTLQHEILLNLVISSYPDTHPTHVVSTYISFLFHWWATQNDQNSDFYDAKYFVKHLKSYHDSCTQQPESWLRYYFRRKTVPS